MDDDIEDLESMRRRIREEGRIRREHELQRRREAEASRRRRRERASSCSSNSSRDLLLMSSPSPPPTSSPDNKANDMYDNSIGKKKEVVSEARQWINSVERNNNSDRKLPAAQSSNVNNGRLLPSNNLNSNSDSSSDVDLSQMSYQLAERNKIKNQKMKNSATANSKQKNNPLSNAWWSSDSDDEDELDVRQLVARQNAEKKKKLLAATAEAQQTKATTSNSMKEVAAVVDSKLSAASQVHNESSEYTPKISNIAAEQIGKQPPNVRGKVDGVKKLDYIREEEDKNIETTTLNRGAATVSSQQANGLNREISMTNDAAQKVDDHIPSSTTTTASATLKSNTEEATKPEPSKQTIPTDPIIGKEVRNRANVDWIELKKCLLVRAVGSCSPKDRVASFDLDHTLVNWRIAGWPSRPGKSAFVLFYHVYSCG